MKQHGVQFQEDCDDPQMGSTYFFLDPTTCETKVCGLPLRLNLTQFNCWLWTVWGLKWTNSRNPETKMWMCSIFHMQFLKCCSFDRSNDDVILHDKQGIYVFVWPQLESGWVSLGFCSNKMNWLRTTLTIRNIILFLKSQKINELSPPYCVWFWHVTLCWGPLLGDTLSCLDCLPITFRANHRIEVSRWKKRGVYHGSMWPGSTKKGSQASGLDQDLCMFGQKLRWSYGVKTTWNWMAIVIEKAHWLNLGESPSQ